MEKDLISIIVPVYNVERYVQRGVIHMKKEEYSQLRENPYLTWKNKYDTVENAKSLCICLKHKE